jgi:uncharacterized RDD family membrane protein YckC
LLANCALGTGNVFHAVLFGLLGAVLGRTSGDVDDVASGVGLGVGVIITWLYFAVLESSEWQATVGKRALGMMVTDLSGGFLMIASTPQKQALHDGLAKTLVIMRRGPRPATALEPAAGHDTPGTD